MIGGRTNLLLISQVIHYSVSHLVYLLVFLAALIVGIPSFDDQTYLPHNLYLVDFLASVCLVVLLSC